MARGVVKWFNPPFRPHGKLEVARHCPSPASASLFYHRTRKGVMVSFVPASCHSANA
jgi:hypothetical protein